MPNIFLERGKGWILKTEEGGLIKPPKEAPRVLHKTKISNMLQGTISVLAFFKLEPTQLDE